MKKSIPFWLNIILFTAMTIHIWVSGVSHAGNPTNSAPAYVTIINAVYYILPITAVNLFGWFRKLHRSWVYIANILLLGIMVAHLWVIAQAEFAHTFYSRFPWITAIASCAYLGGVIMLNLLPMRRPKTAE